jgi:hypothetical protein
MPRNLRWTIENGLTNQIYRLYVNDTQTHSIQRIVNGIFAAIRVQSTSYQICNSHKTIDEALVWAENDITSGDYFEWANNEIVEEIINS